MKHFITCCLLFCFFSTHAFSQTATPPGGQGTKTDPYLISSLENLYWVSDQVQKGNSFSGSFIKQTQEIDASATATWFGGQGWQPIGSSSSRPFSGTYDGNNHVINAIKIDRSIYVGLFGFTNGAIIENLGVTNIVVNGNQYVGALVGQHNSSILTNFYSIGKVTAMHYVGGLVGRNEYGSTITHCYANGYVSGINQVGGLLAVMKTLLS